ncbi:hypothetical protein CF327_g233 [Tilletia walkeri]|uniref:SPT2-domain-containing protein n=1 Tax=Tilletia walkeri TaxID=117179 RepID=A0A8X7N960_9BASI|nr:hypothetical protein CF327_g233 [Tilletia walkeri]KAE8267786.1 hypothetical protein A4X09_0g4566 [Tilletia walkeri]
MAEIHNLKSAALARAESQRKALLAETEAAAKAELERRRAADMQQKKEAELKRAAMVAQQKRLAEQERIRKETAERKKREAELDESQLPDLAQSKSAARVLLNGVKRTKATSSTTSRSTSASASSSGGDRSNMMATFNSVVRKTARKKGSSDLSLLTREEKRNRKLNASLGVDKRAVPRAVSMGSLRGAASHSPSRGPGQSVSKGSGGASGSGASSTPRTSTAAAAQHAISSAKGSALPSFTRKAAVIGPDKTFDEAITLGQKKRDNRSIDEIERDLRAAKEARLLKEGGPNTTLEERKKREEEQKKLEEKRKMAMAEKRRLDLEAQGIFVPLPRVGSEPPVKAVDPSERSRARTSSPAVNPKLLAAAAFYAQKPSGTPPPSKIRISTGDVTVVVGGKSKRGRAGQRKSAGDSRDASPAVNGSSPGAAGVAGATPSGRPETERERFIRLEAEKKRAATASSSSDLSHPASSSHKGKAPRRGQSEEEEDDGEGGYDDEEEEDDADSFIVDDEGEMSGMEEEDPDDDEDDDPRYRKKHKTSHSGAAPSRSSGSGTNSRVVSKGRHGGSGSVSGGRSSKNGEPDYRDEIWRIMGRNRQNYVDMEDSDDDMEATAADIAREETRSARIAKKEDELAQQAEDAHAKEKAARLRMLAKKRASR